MYVSSIIITSFRQGYGGNSPLPLFPPPFPSSTPKKNPYRFKSCVKVFCNLYSQFSKKPNLKSELVSLHEIWKNKNIENISWLTEPRSIAFLLFVLKESFLLDPQRKEVVATSFVEHVQKTFTRKYYFYVLLVPWTISFKINFCG